MGTTEVNFEGKKKLEDMKIKYCNPHWMFTVLIISIVIYVPVDI